MTQDFLTVGLDGSPSADNALEWALQEAKRRGLAVRLVSVWHVPLPAPGPTGPTIIPMMVESARLAAHHDVDAAAKRAADAGVEATTEVVEGNAADELLRFAAHADQLVVGERGNSAVARFFLGSVSTAAVHHAEGPVTVVRGMPYPQHHRVVVGIDGSDHSRAALRRAGVEAAAADAELHVVAAWRMLDAELVGDFPGVRMPPLAELENAARSRVEAVVAQERSTLAQCRVRVDVVHDEPVSALLAAAQEADLLVVGTRGHGAFDRMLLGSVSTACVHHAPCAVQVVPGS